MVTRPLTRVTPREVSIEARQQSFELRVYSLTMLDPARGTLQRVLNDINRELNAAVVTTSLSAEARTGCPAARPVAVVLAGVAGRAWAAGW